VTSARPAKGDQGTSRLREALRLKRREIAVRCDHWTIELTEQVYVRVSAKLDTLRGTRPGT
jgi:hypothetical protein